MLAQRVASAAVGIPLIVLLIWAGGGWYAGAVSFIVLVAAFEYNSAQRGATPFVLLCAGLAAAVPAGAFVGLDWVVWFTLGGLLIPLVWVTLRADPQTALTDWQWAASGLLYVGFLGAHLVLLRELSDGLDWVLSAIAGTFATDTAAYAVGRTMGRRKLAPSISPGKTVEGTIGGIAGGCAMVLLANYFLGIRLEMALIVPLALLLPLAAVLGDLAESLIKRGMHIKDAGTIVPGHGGFLDRLDSILFTVPTVYYFVTWVVAS